MQALQELLANRVLISGLVGWGAAQVLKTIIYALMHRTLDLTRIFGDGLDDHVVRQPGQRPDRQLRRAEFPVFRPRTHADAGAFLQRRGDLRLRRRDEAGHGLFGVDMRCGADDDAGLPRKLMREPLHERGLSAAADDGRHTGSYLQRFRQVHGAYLPSVSFLKDNTRAVLRQEYRKNVDNPEPNMVKFRHGK